MEKIIKYKLYPNEHIDQQEEKHKTYLEKGFVLTRQEQKSDGIIIRNYKKLDPK